MVAQNPAVAVTSASVPGFYQLAEATVSTNDTVQLLVFTAIVTVVVIKASDGSTVTATVSGNTVTVTAAGLTNVRIIIFAWGTK